MKFFDLFAGIGGFRLGMEKNGHECIGSCEIDRYARQIYAKNFGHEPKYRDAKELETDELPDFQCLCAGFPCQSFSLAGRRGGFEDTRGTLFFEIIRIARDKQPSLLFLENVKGLLSHNEGKTYRTIVQALDEVGYDCEWMLINSKYFVPQNRERIFIIGHLRGQGRREILPLGEVGSINKGTQGKTREKGKRVRSPYSRTLDANYYKGGSHGSLIKEREVKIKRVDGNPNVYNTDAQAGKVYDIDGVSPTVSGQRVNSQGFIAEPKIKKKDSLWKGQSGNVYDPDGISPTICSSDATRGNNSSGYIAEPKLKKVGVIGKDDQAHRVYSTDGIASNLNALGGGLGAKTGLYREKRKMVYTSNTNANMKQRIQNRDATWTLTSSNNDFGLMDGCRIRRLTPTECERLQGFPDGYTNGISDTQRYKCLGNAVTVNAIQYIGSFLNG